MKKWSKEMEKYLEEIHYGKSDMEISNLINTRYKTDFTKQAIQTKKNKLGLKSNYKYIPKFSIEIKEYVKRNHKGKSTIQLANDVSKKFNIKCSSDNIQNLKSRIRKNEGFIFEPARNDGCIKKGTIPKNKGKKWNEYLSKEQQEKCRATTFKKGNIPSNRRELFEERIDVDGYTVIKIQDGCLNKNWQYKHRYIYEKYYGPIPKGYKVIFLDGDITNFEISNLKAISSAEELIMNNNNLRYSKKELTETGHLIAQIIHKRGQIKK